MTIWGFKSYREEIGLVSSLLNLTALFLFVLAGTGQAYTNISPSEIRAWRDSGADILLVDIREQHEWDAGHIPDAILMSWNSGHLSTRYDELPEDRPVIIYCRTGNRSVSASVFLDTKGLDNIYNMTGGITSWVTLPTASATIIQDYEFGSGPEGWSFAGVVGSFNVPLSYDSAGGLGLNPAGSNNSFSYWNSPDRDAR